jgi:type IV pilus assembly protein PilV
VNKNEGFSLVEVLVALVILAIGMLGIASLYVESLRAGRAALLRTQAIVLASDMADRIRANTVAQTAYAKTEDTQGTANSACTLVTGAGCTPTEMALNDIAQWLQLVDDRYDTPTTGRLALPNGRGTITVDTSTNPTTYVVSVSWTETGESTPSSYVLRFQS